MTHAKTLEEVIGNITIEGLYGIKVKMINMIEQEGVEAIATAVRSYYAEKMSVQEITEIIIANAIDSNLPIESIGKAIDKLALAISSKVGEL
jgi:hypothetical protein